MIQHESGPENIGLEKEKIVERIRKLCEIKVSKNLLDLLNSVYNHQVETAYLLFRNKKTGIIEIAIPTVQKCTKGSFGFPRSQIEYYKNIMQKEGYELAGNYHSHTDTDGEIDQRKDDKYPANPKYDPIFLSPDDQFPFDEVDRLDQINLLGHKCEGKGWRVGAYFNFVRPSTSNEKDVKFLVDNMETVKELGLMTDHYLDRIKNINLKIDTVESETDPTGKGVIDKYPEYKYIPKITYQADEKIISFLESINKKPITDVKNIKIILQGHKTGKVYCYNTENADEYHIRIVEMVEGEERYLEDAYIKRGGKTERKNDDYNQKFINALPEELVQKIS